MNMTHRDVDWKLALIDLDGTLYRGSQPIAGAAEFIARLRDRGIQPVFFTNNATRTPMAVVQHLERMGIEGLPHEVVTSAQASASRIGPPTAGDYVLYIGQDGLHEALREEGHQPLSVRHPKVGERLHHVKAAVLGLDWQVNYAQLALFCRKTAELGSFILTNGDVQLPAEDGFLPGNGAIGAFVETASRVRPYVAGKPNPDFVGYALSRFGVAREDAFVVGDNPDTDIRCGRLYGLYSIMVETGVAEAARRAARATNGKVGHAPNQPVHREEPVHEAAPDEIRPNHATRHDVTSDEWTPDEVVGSVRDLF
ncbi:HAD-IIA family hydrolase [Alicyclobacillus curvatus]|nr:HAD-IIA family hydrolase [Alicyclobacillus curvatus]